MTTARFGLKQPQQPEWEGPRDLEFSFDRDHTKTVRYQCRLANRSFDFYAPLFLLRNLDPGDVPERLLVIIGKSFEPVRTLGFQSESRPLRVESDVCEYEFKDGQDIVNSKRYDFVHEGQTYSIYIPNEVFEGHPHPRRIYLRMGVPNEE